ncbi:MAG: hypothetical protein LBH25_14930 [Fibromonadaceae bacterium]|jgi:uncharacterized protein (TIGR02145 family)|nr:hypothetical protein [Fibromonadaceae bacterium]
METKLNSKGKRFFAQTLAAGLALAMALTLTSCGRPDDGGGGESNNIGGGSQNGGGLPSSSGGGSSSSRNSEPSPNASSSSRQSGAISGAPVSYGGETYETVVIGTQTWFKRNLNYNPGTGISACYNNEASNCNTYGRLYDWSTAMDFEASCNSASCSGQVGAKHQGVCPSGWRIPNNADWDKLMRYVDGSTGASSPYTSSTAGKYLKATSGWDSYSGIVNLDTYGFSALPGGSSYSYGSFSSVGTFGGWWSASESGSIYAYSRDVSYDYEGTGYYGGFKSNLYSVRCVQD